MVPGTENSVSWQRAARCFIEVFIQENPALSEVSLTEGGVKVP